MIGYVVQVLIFLGTKLFETSSIVNTQQLTLVFLKICLESQFGYFGKKTVLISFFSLQCPFIDISRHPSQSDPNVSRFNESLVEDALRALIESIRHRSGLLNIYKSTPNNAEPDIR